MEENINIILKQKNKFRFWFQLVCTLLDTLWPHCEACLSAQDDEKSAFLMTKWTSCYPQTPIPKLCSIHWFI